MRKFIYIPHWLDSMVIRVFSIKSMVTDLHSTLVRFYGVQLRKSNNPRLIYIPHWLDSMYVIQTSVSTKNIYIPHWLDSMGFLQL